MTQERYNPQEIEIKWQKRWAESKAFACSNTSDKPKYYVLEMFPYPSGNLHMGHVRNYSIGDVLARAKRMQGFNVLHPIGWDAFGLPAENAAIKHNTHPADWTYANIDNMRAQMKRLGFSYDWDRETATCRPEYYRWEQLFFLKLLEKGLAYRKKSAQNWCPSCHTVLANEQVIDGKCWRCDTPVEQKDLEQWFLRITAYADELLKDLDLLKGGWPDRVLAMQHNWIGRSEGAEVRFDLEKPVDGADHIDVFTTRPDTLFGASFIVMAPEHPLAARLIKGSPDEASITAFIDHVRNMDRIERQSDTLEKEGVFTGAYALHPLTGRRVPIWLGNFVISTYGTGAVMSVAAHDQRDFDFAKKYGLEIAPIICEKDDPLYEELKDERELRVTSVDWDHAMVAEGYLVQSGEFTGLKGGKHSEAVDAIIKWLGERGIGREKVQFRLRDWLISRQRYWGNPIPMIHCDCCGDVPVPYDQLPVTLPENLDLGAGETLAEYAPFYQTTCPKCGKPAKRITDTMDTFTCSSWYYLRYTDPHNEELPFSKAAVDRWMPVDNYIGGIEHAILHLLYSRFWTKVLRDLGMIDVDEPFTNLLCQGMVKDENGDVMSKSKGNVVPPSSVIGPCGADTMRLAILFIAPPEKDFDWDPKAVAGANRFIKRAWNVVWQLAENGHAGEFDHKALKGHAGELFRTLNGLGDRSTSDFDRGQFNTAISAAMEIVNAASKYVVETPAAERVAELDYLVARDIVAMLAPIIPHWAEELYHEALHLDGSVYNEPWPEFDPELAKSDEVELAVQIKGKVRGHVTVAADASDDECAEAAKAAVADQLEGKDIKKVIVIKGRLVNIVAI